MIHYKTLKIYVRHGLIVDKIHEIISITQSMQLEKNMIFNTQKNLATKDFEKDFYKRLNSAFYGKTMESVRNCLGLEFI